MDSSARGVGAAGGVCVGAAAAGPQKAVRAHDNEHQLEIYSQMIYLYIIYVYHEGSERLLLAAPRFLCGVWAILHRQMLRRSSHMSAKRQQRSEGLRKMWDWSKK